jgi:hypothetical protein
LKSWGVLGLGLHSWNVSTFFGLVQGLGILQAHCERDSFPSMLVVVELYAADLTNLVTLIVEWGRMENLKLVNFHTLSEGGRSRTLLHPGLSANPRGLVGQVRSLQRGVSRLLEASQTVRKPTRMTKVPTPLISIYVGPSKMSWSRACP